MLHRMIRYIPKSFLDQFRRSEIVRRLLIRWVRNRSVSIMSGIGAGLRFNPGFSNPDYAFGTNELPVQHALADNLKLGDVFYDIGANVGFFSVIGAKLVGEKGHVFAFEPVPENAVYIRTNTETNNFSNITLDQRAVSDHSGTGELLLAKYSGGATISKADTPPDMKGVVPIDLVSVDDLIAQRAIQPPSLVKIDVEGAEMSVLRGMVKTIQQFKPILIYEVDDGNEARFNQKQEECDEFVMDCGYTLTRLEDSYPGGGWIVSNTLAISKK